MPALVILIMRHDLPETAVWLVRQGRFREAKEVARKMYGDSLDMLPDQDVEVPKPRPTAFLADVRQDPIRWRATLYGWIACFAQGTEFSTFAFYLPVLFVMVGVSSILGTDLVTMALYVIAAISGWVGPLLTPKIGHRGISHRRLRHRLRLPAGRGLRPLHGQHDAAALRRRGHAVGPLLGRIERA